jgi:hypothetical protein
MPLVALFLCFKRKNFRAYEKIKTSSLSSATSFLIENGLHFNEDIGFLYQALLSSKNEQDLRSFLDDQSIAERDNNEYKFKKIFHKIKKIYNYDNEVWVGSPYDCKPEAKNFKYIPTVKYLVEQLDFIHNVEIDNN